MERKSENKPLWRKITTGTLYPFANQRNRRVKYKETIRATEEELGKWIDHFELFEPGGGKTKTISTPTLPPPPPEKEIYTVEHINAGWYNVVSPSGKVMNESKLRGGDAEKLKEELEQETAEE